MSIIFVAAFSFNLDFNKSDNLKSENLLILSEAQAQTIDPPNTVTCYGTTSVCYFFFCTRVNTCTFLCPTVKTDSWSDSNTCTYPSNG